MRARARPGCTCRSEEHWVQVSSGCGLGLGWHATLRERLLFNYPLPPHRFYYQQAQPYWLCRTQDTCSARRPLHAPFATVQHTALPTTAHDMPTTQLPSPWLSTKCTVQSSPLRSSRSTHILRAHTSLDALTLQRGERQRQERGAHFDHPGTWRRHRYRWPRFQEGLRDQAWQTPGRRRHRAL